MPERPQLLDDAAFARLLERATPAIRALAQRSESGSQAVGETVARERLRAAGLPALGPGAPPRRVLGRPADRRATRLRRRWRGSAYSPGLVRSGSGTDRMAPGCRLLL